MSLCEQKQLHGTTNPLPVLQRGQNLNLVLERTVQLNLARFGSTCLDLATFVISKKMYRLEKQIQPFCKLFYTFL